MPLAKTLFCLYSYEKQRKLLTLRKTKIMATSTKKSRTLWNFAGKEPESTLHQDVVLLINILKEAGKPVTRDDLITALKAQNLKTKQQPIRILYHWKRYLKEKGYVTFPRLENATAALETPVLGERIIEQPAADAAA
jgi:hypothetical protein